MSVQAKCIIQGKFAATGTPAQEYSVPTGSRLIIDKFTATNTDGSTQTISVHLVPDGGTALASNRITSELSIPAGESVDLPELKSHTLNSRDSIYVVASIADKVVIRASGREVTS